MADAFVLSGSFSSDPIGSPSGVPGVGTPLDEEMTLIHKRVDTIDLTVDSAVTVGFGGVANAHVVVLKTVGGKVKARITSADGSTQSIPVDSILMLTSYTVPVTAIDLTRVAGTATTVDVFLGEHA